MTAHQIAAESWRPHWSSLPRLSRPGLGEYETLLHMNATTFLYTMHSWSLQRCTGGGGTVINVIMCPNIDRNVVSTRWQAEIIVFAIFQRRWALCTLCSHATTPQRKADRTQIDCDFIWLNIKGDIWIASALWPRCCRGASRCLQPSAYRSTFVPWEFKSLRACEHVAFINCFPPPVSPSTQLSLSSHNIAHLFSPPCSSGPFLHSDRLMLYWQGRENTLMVCIIPEWFP